MKKIHWAIFIILLSFGCASPDGALTTFILVRHAEKGNDGTEDPDLTEDGRVRAEKLSFMFKDTPLSAIYSTKYKRTRNTVQPLAQIQNLTVREYEAFKPDVIKGMIDDNSGGTILIGGHTNTTPWTANLLIGEEAYKDYAETEYGIILIITVAEMGNVTSVTRVNY